MDDFAQIMDFADRAFKAEPGADPELVVKSIAQRITALLACPKLEVALAVDAKIAALHQANPRFSWTGIYRKTGETLTICCYRGPLTPHAVIPLSHGICGAAVREGKTLNIPDVKADPRYLSCDFRTKSEIVVPIFSPDGKAIAEIDIDSHELDAFTSQDQISLEQMARELSPLMLQLMAD